MKMQGAFLYIAVGTWPYSKCGKNFALAGLQLVSTTGDSIKAPIRQRAGINKSTSISKNKTPWSVARI